MYYYASLVLFVVVVAGGAWWGVRGGDRQVAALRANVRERGFDPDHAMIQGIAERQAAAKPGFHPIARLRMKMLLRAWHRVQKLERSQ